MATITETKLIDDLDGSLANETIEFGLDGRRYEIELSEPNADHLRDALAPYIDAARKAGTSGGSGNSRKPVRPEPGGKHRIDRDEATTIRAWVRDNGGEISDRGRIPQKYVEAYRNGDTSIFQKDADDNKDVDEPEQAQPEPVVVGGGVGDPFSTFTEPENVHF